MDDKTQVKERRGCAWGHTFHGKADGGGGPAPITPPKTALQARAPLGRMTPAWCRRLGGSAARGAGAGAVASAVVAAALAIA
jgi:hypothetical protein